MSKIKEFSYNGHIEKAELVIDFNSLQIGDVVWTSPCNVCNEDRRHIIIKKNKLDLIDYKTRKIEYNCSCYEILPRFCGSIEIALQSAVANEGRLFRVINPVEDIHNEITEEYSNYFKKQYLRRVWYHDDYSDS